MNNDTSSCFGVKHGELSRCRTCKYAEACKFAQADDKRMQESDLSGSYRHCRYIENASLSNPEPEQTLPIDIGKEVFSAEEVFSLVSYVLRVRETKTLRAVFRERFTGKNFSLAEVARKEGVTRQAVHKRVGKTLAKLFGFKQRRLTDSRLMTLNEKEFALLKHESIEDTDGEIMEAMHLRKNELLLLRKSLQRKLSRYT